MSGCNPLKATSSVRLETPARAPSARSEARQAEKSARAGEAKPTSAEAAHKDKAIRFMGAIIRDSHFPVEAARLLLLSPIRRLFSVESRKGAVA